MSWGRVDDKLHAHPKADSAGLEGMGLWVLALSYCVDQLTDGHVSRERVVRLVGDRKEALRAAGRLVSAGLWDETEDGYQFHDWAKYQPGAADVRAERERKRRNVSDYRARRIRTVTAPVTAPVTGYVPGKSPGCNRVPDPDPIRIDPSGISPPQLSPEVTRAGSGLVAAAAAPKSEPEAEPWTGDEATLAVLDALTRSAKLRGLARPEYALKLARHSSAAGHTGRWSLAKVLAAIRQADEKAALREAGGESIASLASFVAGFVARGPVDPKPAESRPSRNVRDIVQRDLDAETLGGIRAVAVDLDALEAAEAKALQDARRSSHLGPALPTRQGTPQSGALPPKRASNHASRVAPTETSSEWTNNDDETEPEET